MDSIRKVFSYRLKELRGDLTQEAFSEKIGFKLRTYQSFEAGVVPQKETLAELVKKLGLRSETELFLDPDLTQPSQAQALEVITKALRGPALAPAELNQIIADFSEKELRMLAESAKGIKEHRSESHQKLGNKRGKSS